jgi:hypothetical protein
MTILEALKYILEKNPVDFRVGICKNVEIITGYRQSINFLVFDRWPERKRCSFMFPVEGHDSYYADKQANRLWENPRRWELLNWLIEYYEYEEKNETEWQKRIRVNLGL